MWLIPEEAVLEREYHRWDKKPKEQKRPEARKQEYPLKSLVTPHDKSEHIRKFCVTRTYRQLCLETGMSHEEVRRVYNRLHERYKI